MFNAIHAPSAKPNNGRVMQRILSSFTQSVSSVLASASRVATKKRAGNNKQRRRKSSIILAPQAAKPNRSSITSLATMVTTDTTPTTSTASFSVLSLTRKSSGRSLTQQAW